MKVVRCCNVLVTRGESIAFVKGFSTLCGCASIGSHGTGLPLLFGTARFCPYFVMLSLTISLLHRFRRVKPL